MLFRAAAHAETFHAHNHLRAMGGPSRHRDEPQRCGRGENFEFTPMSPPNVEEAK
jgi:rubrerythrin